MAAPDWWNQRIRPKYKDIAAALRPSVLLDELLSEDLITLEDFNNFHQIDRTELERTRRFLTVILPHGGEDRLDKLCEILATVNGQKHIVDLIGQRVNIEPQKEREEVEGRANTFDLSETGPLVQQPVSVGNQSEFIQETASGSEVECGNTDLLTAIPAGKRDDRQDHRVTPNIVPRISPPTPKEIEFNRLCYAVQRHGSSRWLALGLALGYTVNQATVLTNTVIDFADKLQILLDKTAQVHGYNLAIMEIQQACQKISPPILGAVKDELDRH